MNAKNGDTCNALADSEAGQNAIVESLIGPPAVARNDVLYRSGQVSENVSDGVSAHAD
jgi:hypothetical protein